MSALGYHFIAGVLEHLPALLALTCPSVNSYRRLQPHFWSSAYTAWGPDNREAAVRVPSTFPSDRAGSTNAELKASDSSSNPYLGAGRTARGRARRRHAQARAGRARARRPGRPTPRASGRSAGSSGIRPRLRAALDQLEADAVLMRALGPMLARAFLAVKRSEAEAFGKESADFETKHHFWKF